MVPQFFFPFGGLGGWGAGAAAQLLGFSPVTTSPPPPQPLSVPGLASWCAARAAFAHVGVLRERAGGGGRRRRAPAALDGRCGEGTGCVGVPSDPAHGQAPMLRRATSKLPARLLAAARVLVGAPDSGRRRMRCGGVARRPGGALLCAPSLHIARSRKRQRSASRGARSLAPPAVARSRPAAESPAPLCPLPSRPAPPRAGPLADTAVCAARLHAGQLGPPCGQPPRLSLTGPRWQAGWQGPGWEA